VKQEFKAEARLNTISEFSTYLKENTAVHHKNINWLMMFKEIIAAYSESH
jgi:hypothetical protein